MQGGFQMQVIENNVFKADAGGGFCGWPETVCGAGHTLPGQKNGVPGMARNPEKERSSGKI
jgi:hypothetical protein